MDTRCLIFANLLNGVPVRQVAEAFGLKSEDEAMYIFGLVLRRIKNYCFLRARQRNAYPIIVASTIKEAQAYRLTCLTVLPKIDFEKAPTYKDIHGEVINPDNAMAVGANIRP